MNNSIDPKTFGLPPKTVIEQINGNHLAIVISRKSRIIMSDGRKILEKAGKIKMVHPKSKISLKISAPLCSKTKKFLEERGIDVV
jgi:hypothetical protein